MASRALALFGRLKWIDGSPLLPHIEPYRQRLFERAAERDETGRLRYNLVLDGRSKKNWKSTDLVLGDLHELMDDSPHGNQIYHLANDEEQAGDDLELAKLLIKANPESLGRWLKIAKKVIERRDGRGFLQILAAGDAVGAHGKTYKRLSCDEIHGWRNWDILEALQPDPHRLDAQIWIASYASIFHKPGVPLFDLCKIGREGNDPRMLYSWYSADFCTDPDFADCDPETRANPSRASWPDQGYLEQQKRRLPAHKYRRLHLNLPGTPEGSAYQPEPIDNAIRRGVKSIEPQPGISYVGVVDMSGGSSDDAVLAIGYQDKAGRIVIVFAMNQGKRPPFDPRMAVERFVPQLEKYGVKSVVGDAYAGQTFRADFQRHSIDYRVCPFTKHELYEKFEVVLNSGRVDLLDITELEQQLLGLVWRGTKIDHMPGEHDDWANAAALGAWAADKSSKTTSVAALRLPDPNKKIKDELAECAALDAARINDGTQDRWLTQHQHIVSVTQQQSRWRRR